jgi:hypothetical protein
MSVDTRANHIGAKLKLRECACHVCTQTSESTYLIRLAFVAWFTTLRGLTTQTFPPVKDFDPRRTATMISCPRTLLLALAMLVMVSACGGSSSSDPASPPPPPPPTADNNLDWDNGNWDEEDWQ